MRKKMLHAGLAVVAGALMAFVGWGGLLADAMIYGGPNPPPPETGHALLWLVCLLMGPVFAVVGLVQFVVLVRRHLATRK